MIDAQQRQTVTVSGSRVKDLLNILRDGFDQYGFALCAMRYIIRAGQVLQGVLWV
ncbi:MAG: hypothetical protein OXC19_18315 [Bryobacterales bacterium]|nr:hypothetical protein [Bryobacterales bacterium]